MFDAIRTGKKKVETRAATIKYCDIKAGDMLVLVCGKERFEKKIKRVKHFKNVSAMLRVYPLKYIEPYAVSVADLEAAYNAYPSYPEKIKKFGLLAFEV